MGPIEAETNTVLRILEIIVHFFAYCMICYATMKAPSRAVQDQKNREQEESARKRKLNIFYTLMQTRTQLSSYRHTEALNMIDMEFNGIKDITYSWNVYLNHLNHSNHLNTDQWEKERDELFINMLYRMSEFLGYTYTELDIKNKFYSPQIHYYKELNRSEIETCLADILSGRKSFPVRIIKQDQKIEK